MVAAALIAIVAGGLAFRFWPSDERAIRRQLALIESVGSKEAAEQPMEGLVKATQLANLFGDPCRLTVEAGNHTGTYPRQQIRERIVLVRSFYIQVQISLHDLVIDLPEKNLAVIRGTIRLRGQGTSEAIADVQELRAEMAKIDGQWLFTAVTVVEVLAR